MQVFNALPPEGQQMFVEKHLSSLLDFMPKDRSKKSGLMYSQSTSPANRVSSPDCRDATSEEIHRGPEARSQNQTKTNYSFT